MGIEALSTSHKEQKNGLFPVLEREHLESRALFTEDQRDSPSELAFKYSVYRINKDKTLLANTTLVYDIQHVPKDDSFHAAKKGI
ncbi:glutamate receptor ionotropic: kainate 2-like protein [Trichonephila clavipes]|nr:glutamate receptor ionotropic: kainate 2-like protein [Trichonephila clavipes]